MTFAELAAKRRSVRKFTDRQIEKDIIDKLVSITLTAPSSKNTRTTRLVVTSDRELMEGISRMRSVSSSFVKDAPLAFIVMGDESTSDLWQVNSSISATVLQFAAESLGLGSCWAHVCGRAHNQDDPTGETAEDYLHKLIPVTKPYRILCVIVAGYPETVPKSHTPKDDSGKVMFL